jgi:hypothetical protein
MTFRGRLARLLRRARRETPAGGRRIDPARVIAAGRWIADVLRRVQQGMSVVQALAAGEPPPPVPPPDTLRAAVRGLVAWRQERSGQAS